MRRPTLEFDEGIPTWWTQEPLASNILTGWAGGPAGEKLVDLSHEELLDRAIESLSRIFAKSTGWLHACVDKFYYHNWSNDPFCRGAYSYPKVGGLKAAQTLGEPINDTIFFCRRSYRLSRSLWYGACCSQQRNIGGTKNRGCVSQEQT
jgi:hypothetical protein